MGISEQLSLSPKEWILDLNTDSVTLILSEAEMAAANIEAVEGDSLPMLLTTLDPDIEVPAETLKSAKILVIEIRPDMSASLDRFKKIQKKHPKIPVVAAVRNADISLVRMLVKAGVRDVIALPLQISELVGILNEVSSDLKTNNEDSTKLGELVTVVKSIGGVGATTVATHLASQLAARPSERGTCLIDLDLQFGNAASYLGLSNQLSIADLINAGSRIDSDLFKSVATTTTGGLNVIAASSEIMPFESVNTDQILRIVDLARAEYDYVVVDLPTSWTNWTLSLIGQSGVTFMIIELSVASLRQAKRQLQLMRDQGLGLRNLKIVANRVEKKLFRAIDLESATQALGHPVELSIHNDYPLVRAAHDQGVLIQEIRAKSKILNDVENLLDQVNSKTGDS